MEPGTIITLVGIAISLIVTIVKTAAQISADITSLRESFNAMREALAKIEQSNKEDIKNVQATSERLFGMYGNLDNRVTRIETRCGINGSGGSWPGHEVGQS